MFPSYASHFSEPHSSLYYHMAVGGWSHRFTEAAPACVFAPHSQVHLQRLCVWAPPLFECDFGPSMQENVTCLGFKQPPSSHTNHHIL